MKIEPSRIIIDHLASLKSAGSGKTSISDLTIFYIVPVLIGVLAWLFLSLRGEVYNAALTFFGIFIGLLINVQVALFAIFQRKWNVPADVRSTEAQEATLALRGRLLKEANANISYLILVSCIGAIASLCLYISGAGDGWASATMSMIVAHFFLTLLMVIKRLHALFAKEYEEA